MNFRRGNSLIEYLLPVALVLMTVGLVGLLGDLPDLLVNLAGAASKGTRQADQVAVNSFGLLNPDTLSTEERRDYYQSMGISYVDGNLVCVQGTLCLTAPSIPAGSVEVDGSLGGQTTQQLASLLEQLAQQLETTGAPASLVNRVRDLANKGHKLGDIERRIHALCPTTCDADYADPTLRTPIGSLYGITLKNTLTQFNSLQTDLNSYFEQGAQTPHATPEVAAVINYAANTILTIGNNFKMSAGGCDTCQSFHNAAQAGEACIRL